jgi:integrase
VNKPLVIQAEAARGLLSRKTASSAPNGTIFYTQYTIPVSQEIARVVQEQQQVVHAAGNATTLLFPSLKGGVIKQQSFAQRINRMAYDHQIRNANGKLFRFQSHQFRHSVGTRMINLGVPHHFIQRYLGHLGPEMTSRCAHIHDATHKVELSETERVIEKATMNGWNRQAEMNEQKRNNLVNIISSLKRGHA